VPADQLELATDVLFDIVANSRLEPHDVERERMVILEELKMYLDSRRTTSTACSSRSCGRSIRWAGTSSGRSIRLEPSREDLVE